MSNLTYFEREKIEYLLKCKLKIRAIARLLRRDHSVISREIRRNKSPYFPYNAKVAQSAAERKTHKTNKRKLDQNIELRDWIFDRLKDKWSPGQIAGRLKNNPPPELKYCYINYESIYQYIYQNDEDKYLYLYLRRRRRVRQMHGKRKYRAQTIPDRTPIHLRGEEINERKTIGHFESDTVEFRKQRTGLSVQYERKIQLARITKLPTKKAEDTEFALSKTMEDLPPKLRQSITFDNGSENVKHTNLKETYQIETYFCDPYSAWQKGGVENLNGLIRQYLPKKTNLANISQDDILKIQESLNNRPRKGLNFLTPNEVLATSLNEKMVH